MLQSNLLCNLLSNLQFISLRTVFNMKFTLSSSTNLSFLGYTFVKKQFLLPVI